MYIEDEIPRLEYGDALCKIGNKYVTNFIIFRLSDRKQTETVSASTVKMLADRFEALLKDTKDRICTIDFYGNTFGIERLGYIIVPYLLRRKIRDVKNNRLQLKNGPYPPRKDGGYGWFIVEETVDKNENGAEYNSGCNTAVDENNVSPNIYYYWISKYFDSSVYHGRGTRWMCKKGIHKNTVNGIIPKEAIADEDAAHWIEANLIVKSGDDYLLNFPYFTAEQFERFISLFAMNDENTDDLLAEWVVCVRKNFENFVPKRLHDQINQWVSCYLQQIIGYVTDELILRGVLHKPDTESPLTDGVFCVEGKFINP